jgi:hypothetical protein
MSGRGQVVALWLVALLALGGAGGALYLAMQAGTADAVTSAELDAAVNTLETTVDARIAAFTGTGDGNNPVVNAARLNGFTSDAFARADPGGVRQFTCQGIGMWPWSSETKYSQTKLGRVVTSGEGFFDCLVFLPDGATITALRAYVHDLSPTEQVTCYMIAAPSNLTATGNSPAYTESSGDAATPGDVIIEDLSIEEPVVDNANRSYLAECWLSGPGNLALKGVSVEYRLGAPTAP